MPTPLLRSHAPIAAPLFTLVFPATPQRSRSDTLRRFSAVCFLDRRLPRGYSPRASCRPCGVGMPQRLLARKREHDVRTCRAFFLFRRITGAGGQRCGCNGRKPAAFADDGTVLLYAFPPPPRTAYVVLASPCLTRGGRLLNIGMVQLFAGPTPAGRRHLYFRGHVVWLGVGDADNCACVWYGCYGSSARAVCPLRQRVSRCRVSRNDALTPRGFCCLAHGLPWLNTYAIPAYLRLRLANGFYTSDCGRATSYHCGDTVERRDRDANCRLRAAA